MGRARELENEISRIPEIEQAEYPIGTNKLGLEHLNERRQKWDGGFAEGANALRRDSIRRIEDEIAAVARCARVATRRTCTQPLIERLRSHNSP